MGDRNMDLFMQVNDGKKVLDPKFELHLRSRVEEEMLHPLRPIIANRGPDTQFLVADPVELCGKGRPRLFFDVTLGLQKLRICILLGEIGRYSKLMKWEVDRFLLHDNYEISLASSEARSPIVYKVKKNIDGLVND